MSATAYRLLDWEWQIVVTADETSDICQFNPVILNSRHVQQLRRKSMHDMVHGISYQ